MFGPHGNHLLSPRAANPPKHLKCTAQETKWAWMCCTAPCQCSALEREKPVTADKYVGLWLINLKVKRRGEGVFLSRVPKYSFQTHSTRAVLSQRGDVRQTCSIIFRIACLNIWNGRRVCNIFPDEQRESSASSLGSA